MLIGPLLVGAGILGGAIWFDTALHREPMPEILPLEPHVSYPIPIFDTDALLVEIGLPWPSVPTSTIVPPASRGSLLSRPLPLRSLNL